MERFGSGFGILLCVATAPAAAAALRELQTDRPDRTENPRTVDAGHVQVELDAVTYTRTSDRKARAEAVSVLPFNLKLGVTDDTDVQLIVQPYSREHTLNRATGVRDTRTGFGDVTVRVKHNLWGNDGGATALGLMPFVTLPTAGDGFGAGLVQFGLIVPFALKLADGVELGAMTQVDARAKERGGGRTAVFVNSVTVSFALAEPLSLYTEIYSERSSERGTGWVATGDVGITYRPSDNLQLDAGVNLGLTRATDDVQLFVGLSRRF